MFLKPLREIRIGYHILSLKKSTFGGVLEAAMATGHIMKS